MNELETAAGCDWPQVSELLKAFRSEAGNAQCDRNRLLELAEQASALELKYVRALNERADRRLSAEHRCLITSVGMRAQPVLLTLAILRPECIVFAHTRETRDRAQELENSTAWGQIFAGPQPRTLSIEIDPSDSTNTYRQLSQTVQQGRNSNWIIDITGGKKVMGATLSAFAFWRRIPVVYLNSTEAHGVPEPFSERLVCVDNPYRTYGDPLLQAAETSYNCHQYTGAVEALEQLHKTVSVVDQDHMASTAIQLMQCYSQWDRFEHSHEDKAVAGAFYRGFQEAAEGYQRFQYRFLDNDTFLANCEFVGQLEQTYQSWKPSLTDEYRLADVFCNAGRRADQSLFDDAVARLYRCVEMAATLMLKMMAPAFDPDKADWQALRTAFTGADLDRLFAEKSKITGHSVSGLPTQREIGLGQQMVLVGTIAEAVAQNGKGQPSSELKAAAKSATTIHRIFQDMSRKNLLTLRNRSILAHGTKPLDQKSYEQFRSVTFTICEATVGPPRWKHLLRGATFPKAQLTV